MPNVIIQTIKDVISSEAASHHAVNVKKKQCRKSDCVDFLEGEIVSAGTKNCTLSNERGGVYGFAIEFESETEKIEFFNKLKANNFKMRIHNPDEWKPLKGNFYPLYWGKDVNLGFRLYEHTTDNKTSASIQLCREAFEGYSIIYGGVLCKNRDVYENMLHKEYADVLKNA